MAEVAPFLLERPRYPSARNLSCFSLPCIYSAGAQGRASEIGAPIPGWGRKPKHRARSGAEDGHKVSKWARPQGILSRGSSQLSTTHVESKTEPTSSQPSRPHLAPQFWEAHPDVLIAQLASSAYLNLNRLPAMSWH